MTVAQASKDLEPVVGTDAPAPVRAQKSLGRATPRIVRIAVIALILVVAGWLVYTVFEGPIAGAWYRNRQHQLSSEFQSSRPHTGAGAAIAFLQIPRLGTNLVVAEGDTPQQLRGGPGHRVGTPLPGDVGNSVIVGHRSAWGGPFASLDTLHAGDLIVAQTQDPQLGPRNAVFKVVSVTPVSGSDVTPFQSSTDRRLTLVTGRGGQFSNDRLAVVAVSDKVGKPKATSETVVTQTSPGSRLFNSQMLLVLVGIGGAILLGLALRKRYGTGIVLVVVSPLLALGLLGLLLNLDLFAPTLR